MMKEIHRSGANGYDGIHEVQPQGLGQVQLLSQRHITHNIVLRSYATGITFEK